MHRVRIDAIHRLVEQCVGGTPDEAEIEAAGAQMRRAVRSLADKPGTHVSLIDCAEMAPIGDVAIDCAFRQWADPRFSCVRARKVAVVVPSALARMKLAKRVAERQNMAMFASRGDAMRWLFA